MATCNYSLDELWTFLECLKESSLLFYVDYFWAMLPIYKCSVQAYLNLLTTVVNEALGSLVNEFPNVCGPFSTGLCSKDYQTSRQTPPWFKTLGDWVHQINGNEAGVFPFNYLNCICEIHEVSYLYVISEKQLQTVLDKCICGDTHCYIIIHLGNLPWYTYQNRWWKKLSVDIHYMFLNCNR